VPRLNVMLDAAIDWWIKRRDRGPCSPRGRLEMPFGVVSYSVMELLVMKFERTPFGYSPWHA
jgi:hypothetical protein